MDYQRDSKCCLLQTLVSLLLLAQIGCDKLEPRRHGSAQILADDAPAEQASDPYQVPSGNVRELLEFIDQLHEMRETTSAEEYDRRAYPALKKAAFKIVKVASPTDTDQPGFERAVAISLYFRVTESGDNPEFTTKKPLASAARGQLLHDIENYFSKTRTPSIYALVAAEKFPVSQARSGRPKLAVEFYRQLGPILAESQDRRCAAIGEMMLGSARRLELIGKPIEVSGNTMDGRAFCWSKYRGRVVLVDFWSIHCGPCIADLRQLQKAYEQYHGLGFDIVGINLDDNLNEVKQFLEEMPLPWVTLYDGSRLESPMAKRYGAVSLPTCLLVDQSGRVVSIQARGYELAAHLDRLLAYNK